MLQAVTPHIQKHDQHSTAIHLQCYRLLLHSYMNMINSKQFIYMVVGCGTGRYMNINSNSFKLGSDHCCHLVEIARDRGHEVMVCDNLRLPYRNNSFDAVISIAVIHHLTTPERRLVAVQELARILRPGGKLMIYVWAMEQRHRKVGVEYN